MANLQDLEALPKFFKILANDVIIAEGKLDQAEPQFRRRSYVRAVFALIEGMTFAMKQFTLAAHEQRDDSTFSPKELARLQGKQNYRDCKGIVQKVRRSDGIADDLKFAFKTFAQARGSTYTLKTSGREWQLFKEAIKLRNRITHPKAGDDLTICDEEMKKIQKVAAWYRKVTSDLLQSRGPQGGAT